MKLKPLHDRVIVEPGAAEEVTSGGIIVPVNAKEKPSQGVVKAAGPGRVINGEVIPLQVKEGDVVMFPPFAGVPVTVDGVELLILSEHEIQAIVEG